MVLTVLIAWHTIAVTKAMAALGDLLQEEQNRLRILMISFGMSYIGYTLYFLYD